MELARIARRGDLPEGQFGALVQDDLAEPMDPMFAKYTTALANWPHLLPDEALDHLPPGEDDESLRLVDWLGPLRANAAGERCRLLLDSGNLVRDRRWRLDKLLPHWVAHLAAHAAGCPMTTVVISKAGSATLAPLDPQVADEHWRTLLRAWREGLRRPLPFAVLSAQAWLAKDGPQDNPAAYEAARAAYEDSEPPRKGRSGATSERERNDYLARAFPSFEALWQGGEFGQRVTALLQPMTDALGEAPKEPSA
jgi:exodeoxyribonuclease V gamma subunit